MPNHITFPSIDQYKNAIKAVHSTCHYHQIPVPTLVWHGTVKIHGTNAGICRPINGGVNDIWFQSRERVITPESDNAGFAMWCHGNREKLNQIFDFLADMYHNVGEYDDTNVIQIFGEWFGGNIQSGVGVANLPKSFCVFDFRVSPTAESTEWGDSDLMQAAMDSAGVIDNMYHIEQFPTWNIHIDMTNPQAMQNTLIDLTTKVEEDCPVARQLLGADFAGTLIGEGIGWFPAIEPEMDERLVNTLSGLRFKVKGKKHSSSKVKTIAPVDTEKLESVQAFVEYAVTENRLNQGLDKLREKGLPIDSTSTGEYIKWIMGDILKEELDAIAASGLNTREITGPIANKARKFFLEVL